MNVGHPLEIGLRPVFGQKDDAAVLDRLESVVDTLADIVFSVNETTT